MQVPDITISPSVLIYLFFPFGAAFLKAT